MTLPAPPPVDADLVVPQRLIDQFASEGAVKIEQPFSTDWVEALTEEFHRIVADWEAGSTAYPVVRAPNGMLGVQNVILRSPVYRRWAVESSVAAVVGQITQSETVRFYFDNFFCKEGDKPEAATPLHHDVPSFGMKGTKLPSFWLALTDVDVDNAPLVTYAGSHADTSFMFRSPVQKPGLPLLEGYREPAEIPAHLEKHGYERKVWPCRKGDVLMVHPFCIHGSLARPPGARGMRIGFSSRWLGDDVTWSPTLYNEVEAQTHDASSVVGAAPNDAMFPVVWRRGEGTVARTSGAFTSHITLEPRKGYHTTA